MSPRDEDFERLGPPRKGEWRSIFQEPEQTFEAYAASAPRHAGGIRLLPLGPLSLRHRETIALMARYAEAFFGLESRVLPGLPMFPNAHISPRDQVNSSIALDELAARTPGDARIFLGITALDLFARGKNYVFGEGDLTRRIGICSLARLQARDPGLEERRALRLLTHEAGHILSIAHCVTHRCAMQGANTLPESDGHPMEFCRKDLRKLVWNTGVDPERRARALDAFYRERGWADEAHRIAGGT